MTPRKLAKLRAELSSMRRSPQKARDIESIAERLGRKKENRGKEPTWMSTQFQLPALTIPNHKGRDLATGTRNSILNQLEHDLLAWEEWLEANEHGGEENDES